MASAADRGPVVVTGGAGAIGSVLVRALLARGHEVRVLDNFSGGKREHLPDPASTPGLGLVAADLKAPGEWARSFAGATSVWHLAANSDIQRGTRDPRIDLENGTLAAFHVLEAARHHQVSRALFSSSSAVYGRPAVLPTPESYGPLRPESLYGASKLAAEGLFSAYAHSYGIRAHLFRFANIVGPFMTHAVLFDFFEKLRKTPGRLEVLGDGRQAKSYLRSEDCVRAMLLASDRAEETVNIFNLGTTDRISVREIAEKVVKVHGGTARIEYTGGELGWTGDIPQQLLAIERIQALGWRPEFTSEQAIDRTISEIAHVRDMQA